LPIAGKEGFAAPSSHATAPNPRGRTGLMRASPWAYNGAGRGDTVWEHAPLSSLCEATIKGLSLYVP
jgi:hypothetical protein